MLKGYVHPDFWSVARLLKKFLPRSGGGGAAVAAYHRGEKVVDLWGGTKDATGSRWEEDTLSLSYSTTKGVASTALHMLVDRGELDYDDPVARYWPEFAAGGKSAITVRQLMCHEAGLYDIRSMVTHANEMLEWKRMTELLAAATPVHPPGAAHGYHGLTYGWLVGELVQRISGRTLGEFLEVEIARPLDLDGLFVGLPKSAMHRRATLIQAALTSPDALERRRKFGRGADRFLKVLRVPVDLQESAAALIPPGMEELDFNSEALAAACMPAMNGIFTARSLARLYATLANGGELDGVRLLGPETLARATQIQNRGLDRVVPLPMHWRLGYHRVFAPFRNVERAFGHFGFGGSGAWADPHRNLSVALTVNHGIGTPFGDSRMARVGAAAIKAADRRG